jgi:hypothetical protein
MASSRVVRLLLLGIALGAGFASCAKGSQVGDAGGTGGASTSSSSGSGEMDAGPAGKIGSACTSSCAEGTCTLIGNAKYCTTPCPPQCPGGTYCSIIDGNPLCVPDLGQQCDQCTTASDCKLPSDACLTAPLGDSFCAEDCSVDGICPSGFVCTSMTSYESLDGDAGTGGAASGDAGTGGAASSGAGTGGAASSGAGTGGALPSAPDKWCVPDDGASCPCNGKRNGVTNACSVMNDAGTCTGTETCNGASSTWTCSAMTPMPEICNGLDDNCSGQIDEGNPNQLCAYKGPQPPNANWACVNGMCELGACDPGYTAFPTGTPATGCACQIDANEPNGSCAAAKNVGTVTSTGTTPIVIEGTLSSLTDIDYYAFTTTDVDEMTTNSYHVSISFTLPVTNDEFIMDVIRGTPCVDVPTGAGTAITSYDWCVNASNGTIGEAPCGPTGVNHCTDYSSPYYLRVYRQAAATPTCTEYQLTVTGGGGTCDLTQQCM